MKTSTKIVLGGIAAVGVGAVLYRRGIDNIRFDIDGFSLADNLTDILIRIRATNPNRFFGYPVPQMFVVVFDKQGNQLGTIITDRLQYIQANGVSFLYGIIKPTWGGLANVLTTTITTGEFPTDLVFTGEITIGGFRIPFDTGEAGGPHLKPVDNTPAPYEPGILD